jgi:hypothetical protein
MNGDGKVSKDEWMAASATRFEKICTDGDAAISLDEWKAEAKKEASTQKSGI